MSLVGFRASNHPQQVGRGGPDDEVDDRGTPQDFWDELNERYWFTLDVAAAPHNAKTANYYTRLADGLLQPWTGSVWCNPPYSGLDRWLEKAWTEWQWNDGRRRDVAKDLRSIVMLLPANRPEQPWWQQYVEPYRDRPGSPLSVEFLPGRLWFIKPGATEIKPNERPPFGCCLLVWSRTNQPNRTSTASTANDHQPSTPTTVSRTPAIAAGTHAHKYRPESRSLWTVSATAQRSATTPDATASQPPTETTSGHAGMSTPQSPASASGAR